MRLSVTSRRSLVKGRALIGTNTDTGQMAPKFAALSGGLGLSLEGISEPDITTLQELRTSMTIPLLSSLPRVSSANMSCS
jgi:hypothetical protein